MANPDPVPSARILPDEWPALALSFLYFFAVLSAYYMLRPVREQLTAAVGSTQLPWFYLAVFVVTLLLTPVFAGLASRYPRRVLVPVANGFFILCLLAFVPLFLRQDTIGPRALGITFFVWLSVFNLFVVSVFWTFMSDIWDEVQARRLFPIISVAGTLGAIAGPMLTRTLVTMLGVAHLLVVSASLLTVAVGCVLGLGRWARRHGTRRSDPGNGQPLGGGMLDGLKQVFATPFMRNMALLMLLADGIGTVNYALVADYSGATFGTDAVARTRFAANLDLAGNLLTMLLQVTLTRWLLPTRGPGALITVWGVVSLGALSLVIFSPDPHAPLLGTLPAVAIAMLVSRALAYGMAEPARHSLFTRLPRNERYKGQNVIDTAVWRFGDVVVAGSMNLLRSFGVGVAGFAGMAALSAATAAWVGWRLARSPSAVNREDR